MPDTAVIQAPWERVGTRVEGLLTAEECIRQGGLDWDTMLVPLQAVLPSGERVGVDRRYATLRSDTHAVLGIVGAVYEPWHNRDAFRFFDEVVAEKTAHYHFVGSVGNGRKIYLSAKLPEHVIYVGGVDPVELYLLLTTSHDGTSKIMAAATPVRLGCKNMVRAALRGAVSTWSVRHTSNASRTIDEARRNLQLAINYMGTFETIANQLFEEEISAEDFQVRLESANFGERAVPQILDLFNYAPNLENVRGTRWAAYNAVAEFFDYRRNPRSPAAAANSALYHTAMKDTAFALLRQ